MPRSIRGLSEIGAGYDGLILDLWGVIHDGVAPLPAAIPALLALKKTGKKVWLLSNAPRRAYTVAAKMEEMGIAPGLYDGLLTSGEASWQALGDGLLERWGRRCLHIGRAADSSLYESLEIDLTRDPAAADFVLASGVEDFADPLEKYLPLLRACLARGLPMLCANPDRVVHIEDKLVICAGTLAHFYEGQGGQVVSFGKPYRDVYRRCLQEMGPRRRVLAVGDSMLTDIAGATGAGLDSALVTSGIHREEFAPGSRVEEFLRQYPYRPTYILPQFAW